MSDTESGAGASGSSETTTDGQLLPVAKANTTETVDSDQQEKPLVRHENLSYDDGNLLVVAESTMFQVHRSVLARKSALFKDLLSLPQPDTEEKIDDLPVVRLLDSSADVALLIDSIYNGEKYRYKEEEGPAWPTVHRLLTLGTKYQIEELREEAIQQLHRRYPKKIVGWDETCRTDNDPNTASTILVSYPIDEDIIIANVARAMDLPDIHLAALYGCCSLPFDTLVNGRTLDDGSIERLSPSDLICCLQGKENLLVTARSNLRMNLFAPESAPENCHTPESCIEKTAIMLTRYRTAEARPSRMYDPLRPEDVEIERQCADIGLCHDCVKFYIARHASLRQEIRSNLDKYICSPSKA
ncbi:hypothetical protein BDY19DRAFT_964688 [Irpex rosettiformis]|uniref:Uncharacterized protein n=1 Tax=Irpex rosettiformis TaxID=378272 RepID=A0ACB8TV89_9APHY|nr:hypothetical protein BDY19DRAFT_964688 [Irpex rosettiformis]